MRRIAAIAALVLLAAAVVLAAVVAIENFPRGLTVLASLALAVVVTWWGVAGRGLARHAAVSAAAFAAAAILVVVAVVFVVFEGSMLGNILVAVLLVLSLGAARRAFASRVQLPAVPRPEHPVLIYNPKSGGGKATRFELAREARARGIEPIELGPGDDLEALVAGAIAGGADALAVAGGDGTQAIVAGIAAEHDLPYACIPAGTRNHFALDLGVDRDDVVGALEALVNGGERRVDLAEVNGRVFVNNVSLGIYAEAVQQAGYRDAKLHTLVETATRTLGAADDRIDLTWTDPSGASHRTADVMLVSNDSYRLGRALAAGTRPRLDGGVLGIAVAAADEGRVARLRTVQWSAPSFEIGSKRPVPAGIDGEAAELDAPLRFRSRPRALRVRIARDHPGASPSALIPKSPWDAVRALAVLAVRGSNEHGRTAADAAT